ncbi:hypothetical protein EVAR_17556_1 [Eumeta japonica]|uniref:Uncharacterized protein n=1 Tax=Eumeta variegata TaxID=151549 RepID=A0A4C1UC47_EUMVA|nr:hypothetical protein EVAR_17556_1 [Eumeta japonica]
MNWTGASKAGGFLYSVYWPLPSGSPSTLYIGGNFNTDGSKVRNHCSWRASEPREQRSPCKARNLYTHDSRHSKSNSRDLAGVSPARHQPLYFLDNKENIVEESDDDESSDSEISDDAEENEC